MTCNCNQCIRYIQSAIYTGIFDIHTHIDRDIDKIRKFLGINIISRKGWKIGILSIQSPDSKDKIIGIKRPVDVEKIVEFILKNSDFSGNEILNLKLALNKIVTPYKTEWKKEIGVNGPVFKKFIAEIINLSIDRVKECKKEYKITNKSNYEKFIRLCKVCDYVGLELPESAKKMIAGKFTEPFNITLTFNLKKSKFE